MIGEYLRFGVGGGDIEPEFFDESPFDLRGECLEGFEYMGVIPVYIEVVGVDGSDYRNLREKLEERSVEFISLRNDYGRVAYQHICPVIAGNSAEKGRAADSARGEDMGGESGSGGFPMSPCYGHTCLTLSYFTEGAGAFDDPVSVGVDIHELAEIFRDSRGIDDKSLLDILWDCVISSS